jgi:hypothetical protein
MTDIGIALKEINVIKARTRTREKNNGKNLESGDVLVLGILQVSIPYTYLAVCFHVASLLGSPGSRSLCVHQ